jgi:EAL and modified HD-GYP domain-containing signal transduction protein
MATPLRLPGCFHSASSEPAVGMHYASRQPILNLHGKVHGYELFFRNVPEAAFRGDGDFATRNMLDSVLLFGLEKMTLNLPGFVNCTAETLTSGLVHIFPAKITVLEIREGMELSPKLISACSRLRAAGYKLALDHFTWRRGIEALLEAAAYIKVDFSRTDAEERRELLRRLTGAPVALVAENVETQEQFAKARAEGFSLVQGFYFCRPVLLENRGVPSNCLAQVEILRQLQNESLNLRKLTELVKRDPSLTYRLLRLINSPICAMQQEVTSIQAALLAVGEETFRRMASVAITREMNAGHTTELLRMAFVRGRFCETAAAHKSLDGTEQYLLGLLSLLPAMLRVPMKELTPSLPLRKEILRALEGERVAERGLLEWLERYERADWAACDKLEETLNVGASTLIGCHQEALTWAEAALYFA